MTLIIILLILVFAILLAKIIFFFLQNYKPQKVKQLTVKDISFPLPIFALLEKDVKAGNSIDRVFISITKKKRIFFSVVTKDEDFPKIDLLYDAWRKFFFGRIKDIETFSYLYKANSLKNKPDRMRFNFTYSGKKKFPKIAHFSKTVPFDKFKTKNNRPIIYINTWNHSFSETDNNPNLKKSYITKYPIYSGRRSDAERIICKTRP